MSHEKTVIELCGVPGGGKSTTADAFARQYPTETHIVELPFRPVWYELWCAVRFALWAPLAFFTSGWFVVRNVEAGFRLYSLHLWVRACAKYAIAQQRTERFVLIDEGLLHIATTLPYQKLTTQDLQRYVKIVLIADCVCIAQNGTFHRFREDRHVLHPRVRRGKQYLREWKDRVCHNTSVLLGVLQQKTTCVWEIPQNNESGAIANSLKNFLRHRGNVKKTESATT